VGYPFLKEFFDFEGKIFEEKIWATKGGNAGRRERPE
jgi:hypothetical protein